MLATARKAGAVPRRRQGGARREPGRTARSRPEYALRERLLGAARGIGANIEAVPSSMIAMQIDEARLGRDARRPAATTR